MDMTPQAWPDWYDGRHINEVLFCQQFLDKHPMKCVRGRLFTVDGLIEDEGQIGNLILEEISGVLTANLSKTVANLLASIKLQAYSPPLPIETDHMRKFWRRSVRHSVWTSSRNSRTACILSSAHRAFTSPAVRHSGWPSPVPC